jgi:zinc transporter, ZIP family
MEVPGMFSQEVLIAFGLTLFAGLSTGIGSALAFFTRTTNTRFLAIALGFSAGVMIYVAMIEIFFKARESLVSEMGESAGNWVTLLSFFGGIMVIAIIDRLVPSAENPHEIRFVEEVGPDPDCPCADEGNNSASGVSAARVENTAGDTPDDKAQTDRLSGKRGSPQDKDNQAERHKKKRLLRMGYLSAIAITIHNFPEGLATFIAALTDLSIGIPIAIAIAIHNIPEGIAVSVPIYYATGSRRKAFKYSFLSGLAEPVGALIGWLVLMPYLNESMFGIIFAGVAGIMVFISIDELLPAAREYGEHHLSIYGLIAGMAVMGVSLVLLM